MSDNQSWVRNHEADLVKHQAELERLEKNLELAEDEMENIRQSLKGKTEEFSQQIEVHQKELAPWTEKIVAKQSQEDMAQSEHDLLEEKAKNSLASFQDAEAALETLKNAQAAKESEISELEEAIASSDGQIASIQAKIKVSHTIRKSTKDFYGYVANIVCCVDDRIWPIARNRFETRPRRLETVRKKDAPPSRNHNRGLQCSPI